ncbi:MAG TPA: type II secretion system F family protein [Terriglobales bacterium]|nr:type II secretion system F family protein [Terriglobales bacterium]
MAEFLVKVADERGRILEQVENGFSASEIRDRFSQQGFLVYSVKPRALFQGGSFNLPQRRRLKTDQFLIFNSQFLTLIRAGLTIVNSLDLLIKRQRNPFFRSTLENVRDRVKSGELLSDAFAEQGVYPKMYTTTILAGEKSGNLEEVLNRYIIFQRLAQTFKKKLQASLVYPTLLIVLVIGMLGFLLTYVVPKFGELYSQISANGELPALTLFMLAVGDFTRKYFPLVGIALVAALFFLWRWKQTDRGARQIDNFRLRMPLLGGIWLKYQIAIFSRMLGTLLSGGLPLVPAMETAASSMQSRALSDALMVSSVRVREGQPLAKSLEETEKFPPLAVEMIEVGESTGALPAMLTSVAEFYEEDVETALTAAMALIEPAILIVMGVIVAFVLLSLYMPIFTLGAGGIK